MGEGAVLLLTREKTVAKTSFLCGFRGKGESSNPLTHAKRLEKH